MHIIKVNKKHKSKKKVLTLIKSIKNHCINKMIHILIIVLRKVPTRFRVYNQVFDREAERGLRSKKSITIICNHCLLSLTCAEVNQGTMLLSRFLDLLLLKVYKKSLILFLEQGN